MFERLLQQNGDGVPQARRFAQVPGKLLQLAPSFLGSLRRTVV